MEFPCLGCYSNVPLSLSLLVLKLGLTMPSFFLIRLKLIVKNERGFWFCAWDVNFFPSPSSHLYLDMCFYLSIFWLCGYMLTYGITNMYILLASGVLVFISVSITLFYLYRMHLKYF